jgi:hypothetical protein
MKNLDERLHLLLKLGELIPPVHKTGREKNLLFWVSSHVTFADLMALSKNLLAGVISRITVTLLNIPQP